MQKKPKRKRTPKTEAALWCRFRLAMVKMLAATGVQAYTVNGGVVDIVAWDRGVVRLVKCCADGEPSRVVLDAMRALEAPPTATKSIVWRDAGARGIGRVVWVNVK